MVCRIVLVALGWCEGWLRTSVMSETTRIRGSIARSIELLGGRDAARLHRRGPDATDILAECPTRSPGIQSPT
jgi:hypothetical protein